MSARIPPGYAELWCQFNTAGDAENMYCSIGVKLAVGVGATQALTDTFLGICTNALKPAVSGDFTLGPGHVIWGQDGGDVRIDGSASAVAGTAAGTGLPQNCAALVRKITAAGGRRGRGRMYWPGVPEGQVVSNGQIQSTWVATLVTAANNLYSILNSDANVDIPVLFHDTAPFTPTAMTSLEPQNRIATQRRRLRP